jgi:hypothetical protein
MTSSVQLPVQLPYSLRTATVLPTPCLPLGKLHACTRAARLPRGIGSWHRLYILLTPYLDRYSLWPKPSCPRLIDQQSHPLLAIGSKLIDLTHVLPIVDGHPPRWEWYGKIGARETEALGYRKPRQFIQASPKNRPTWGVPGIFRLGRFSTNHVPTRRCAETFNRVGLYRFCHD